MYFYELKELKIMNTQKLSNAISQLQRIHRDMNDCANKYILKDAIDQLQEQVKLFAIPDVTVAERTFCNLYKKECMGGLCSVTPHPDKCYHLRLQNAR